MISSYIPSISDPRYMCARVLRSFTCYIFKEFGVILVSENELATAVIFCSHWFLYIKTHPE